MEMVDVVTLWKLSPLSLSQVDYLGFDYLFSVITLSLARARALLFFSPSHRVPGVPLFRPIRFLFVARRYSLQQRVGFVGSSGEAVFSRRRPNFRRFRFRATSPAPGRGEGGWVEASKRGKNEEET